MYFIAFLFFLIAGKKTPLPRPDGAGCVRLAVGGTAWGFHVFLNGTMETPMRKLLLIGLGLCALGAMWKAEEEEKDMAVAMSPFLAALALEAGIFLLRRHQGSLLGSVKARY